MQTVTEQITSIKGKLPGRAPVTLRGLKFETAPPPPQAVATKLDELDVNHHPLVRAMVNTARSWHNAISQGEPISIVLMSQHGGVGKSHTAEAIWWTRTHEAPNGFGGISTHPRNPMWQSSVLFSKAYDATLDGDPLAAFIRPGYHDFVIIDDLGKEVKPQYVAKDMWQEIRQNVWFSVIDHCYRKEIPMVITTNKTPRPDANGHTLESWIGEYALDRLYQMAPRINAHSGYMIDLSSVPSYRKEASGR